MAWEFSFPDPEFAEAFAAYRNYLEDLAGWLGGNYGLEESLTAGVHDAVWSHPNVTRLQRRDLDADRRRRLEQRLRRAWHQLRVAHAETPQDANGFDDEANALLPVVCYYAAYHMIGAMTAAARDPITSDHAASLRTIGNHIAAGRLPHPWSAHYRGCPDLDDHQYFGLLRAPDRVHPLSSPDPDTTDARLAMLLRTTRQQELDRLFRRARLRDVAPGRQRRNLHAAEKATIAANLGPTTLFDALYRLRKKASYDDAEVFVLGAADEYLPGREFSQRRRSCVRRRGRRRAPVASARGPRRLRGRCRARCRPSPAD